MDVDVNDICVQETDCDSDNSIAFPVLQSDVKHNLTADNYADEDDCDATRKQQQKCKQQCCKLRGSFTLKRDT